MSFFTNLRRVNKLYPNTNQFPLDNVFLVQQAPSGFTNVFSSPVVRNLGNNRFEPGYNVGNNQFVRVTDVNSVLRNNDVGGIRNIFQAANTQQINSLGALRRVDNIPDPKYHNIKVRQNAVKSNYPSTATRTPDGIETVLIQNPRLHSHMTTLKAIGAPVLLGVGIYLIFTTATLVQDIIAALNRVGGSYYVIGRNGGDDSSPCLLVDRTCRLGENILENDILVCPFDPLTQDQEELRSICNNYNYEAEQSVCRASDPTADPDSPQYVDISDLPPGQTLMCIEPYDMADLIGDLGLDFLLGDEGLLNQSSGSLYSVSEKLLPLILIIGGIILLVVAAYFVFKRMLNKQTVDVAQQQQQPAVAGR